MLLLASILLSSYSFAQAPACPSAFSFTNTTVGAVSDSTRLSICVSKAVFIKGSNGSLNLVIGASSSQAPRCLVYPNGLSLDLTFSLLSTGHVGCWSLYPPRQPVAIVNIGKPSSTKLQSALRSFRPEIPRVFYRPSKNIKLGSTVQLYSSAKDQTIKTKLLNLPAQVRFRPVGFRWLVSQGGMNPKTSGQARPTFGANVKGITNVALSVSYSLEYSFSGLSPWTQVRPNILLNAVPTSFLVGSIEVPNEVEGPPRLVDKQCTAGSLVWRC